MLYTSSTNAFALGTPVTGASLTIAGVVSTNAESTGGLTVSGVASITTLYANTISATSTAYATAAERGTNTTTGNLGYLALNNVGVQGQVSGSGSVAYGCTAWPPPPRAPECLGTTATMPPKARWAPIPAMACSVPLAPAAG